MSKMYFLPFRPAFDSAGVTVPGSLHWFTLAGTNTPSAPFTDATLVTPLGNPVVSNGIGYLPPVYLNPAISYRVRIYLPDAEVGVDTPLEGYDPYVPALVVSSSDFPAYGAVADGTITIGQLVNLYVTGGLTHMRLADGSVSDKPAHAFCVETVASGATGSWCRRGIVPGTSATAFAADLWLSQTVPGAWQTAAPAATAGMISQHVGMVLPGTGVEFISQPEIVL